MKFVYHFVMDRDDDGITVTFPDVPEAITGADSEAEAKDNAYDALICALGEHMRNRSDIPEPGYFNADGPSIHLNTLHALKLALYRAMKAEGLSNTGLADQLGVNEALVRRLLDLDHASTVKSIEAALRLLKRRPTITVESYDADRGTVTRRLRARRLPSKVGQFVPRTRKLTSDKGNKVKA